MLREIKNAKLIKHVNPNNGFTLIEIILSLTVIFLVSTTSYLVFIRFNRQQNLNVTYDNLKNALNEARSNTASQVSTNCAPAQTLVGYQVDFDTTAPTYSYALRARCSLAGVESSSAVIKSVTLPRGITLGSNRASVIFLVLSKGVRNPVTLTLSNGTKTRTITINPAGIIQ